MPVLMRWVVAVLALAAFGMSTRAVPAPVAVGGDARPSRTTFAYAAGTQPADEQLFRDAIAAARPEAQRLIARVAPYTEVSFTPRQNGPLGTAGGGDGAFTVDLDLPRAIAAGGPRAVERLVLHELGHVVDRALLSERQRAELDSHFPTTYACPSEGCAPRVERFAETFAKWALGDIGAALYVGYAVPPPVITLDRWGEPLLALASG